MRKSKKIELALKNEEIGLYRQELNQQHINTNLEREKFEFEKQTKDRVDISLKELEDLKARNKELESRNDSLHSILKKITHPLNQCQIPSKIFEKIINNEFEYEVKTIYEPMRNESYIYIKYIVKGGIEHD